MHRENKSWFKKLSKKFIWFIIIYRGTGEEKTRILENVVLETEKGTSF